MADPSVEAINAAYDAYTELGEDNFDAVERAVVAAFAASPAQPSLPAEPSKEAREAAETARREWLRYSSWCALRPEEWDERPEERREMAQSVVDAFRRVQGETSEDFTVTLDLDQARFIGEAMGYYVNAACELARCREDRRVLEQALKFYADQGHYDWKVTCSDGTVRLVSQAGEGK